MQAGHIGLALTAPRAAVAGGGGPVVPPNAFAFTDQTSVPLSTLYVSNTVVLAGGSGPWVVTVSGAGYQYDINGGGYTSAPGVANVGDSLTVRGTSSGSLSTGNGGTVSVDATSDTFTLTTVANTEASDLILRFTTDPGSTRRGLVDNLVGSLKTAGTWTLRDVIHVYAAHDSQAALRNWKANLYNATAVNGGFTADRGYAGDGSTAYVDTNFADNTAAVNWTQNSADFFIYINVGGGTGSTAYTVGLIGVAGGVRLNPSSGGTLRGRLHQGADDTPANAVRTGGFHVNRSGASAVELDRNAASIGTSATASTGTSAANIAMHRSNTTMVSTDRGAVLALGGSLTTLQKSDEYNAFLTYLTAIGAN